MKRPYAYLPCNGLDKPEGPLAREAALALLAGTGGELVCPVLLARAPRRYARTLAGLPLFVVDGCATRCASCLAADHNLKIERRLSITEAKKAAEAEIEEGPTPGPLGLAFVRALVEGLLREEEARAGASAAADFAAPVEYATFRRDKFLFRVPRQGYLFNENDCWARVSGNRARVGVSDYVQHSLADVIFCTLPPVGAQIEQFGEAGTVESNKATFEVVCPLSGTVVAVNQQAAEAPEVINEDPYERGWLCELELSDLAGERELLLDCAQYLQHLRDKTARDARHNGDGGQ